DLEPGNIFLARGRCGDAKCLLLDWGVSVVRSIETGPGMGGRPGGTPGYMAPEQITGRVGDLDARTDVYGLGCLLYEFVAWRPAVRRGDPRRALRDALRGNLVAPHLRQKEVTVPHQLSDICMKALSFAPEDRYATPAELATALRGLLGQ
ncbi:MAG: serine/threonine protein kinase, partial [Deltaproteobacteria bacterium]|nr:serine/threonine protein kinase [Deltaproteobacteria bacterium]